MAKRSSLVGEPRTETTLLPTITTEEERYDLDQDDSLIQYEMNLIELPFFSRDDRVKENTAKKYLFSADQYVYVIPGTLEECGRKIPQDFDEKVFYGLLRLYRKNNSRRIVTTIYELLSYARLNDSGREYERVKQSLHRLRDTTYKCSNILYNAEKNQRITDERKIQILQSIRIVRLDDLTATEKETFKDRLKETMREIVVVEFSDFMEQNIINKGFLYYDAVKLLDVDNATARKLYIMLEKWRGWEKTDSIVRSCRFIASRLPLSWEASNIPGTINVIEKASRELKEKGLIEDFTLERGKPLKESKVAFHFDSLSETEKGRSINQHNRQLAVSTGQEDLSIVKTEDKQLNLFDPPTVNTVTDDISALWDLVPGTARTATIRALLERYLSERGVEYVASNIEYTKSAAKDFAKMFPGALEKDFAEGLRLTQKTRAMTAEEDRRKIAAEEARTVAQERDDATFRAWWGLLSESQKAIYDTAAREMAKRELPENASSQTIEFAVAATYRKKVWREVVG